MKPKIDTKPSDGGDSWSAAVAALHNDNDNDDDKRSDHNDHNGSMNTTSPSSSFSSYIEHKVLPTDTLQGLCLAYKISAVKLRMANKFSGNSLILAPKTLKIPINSINSPTSKVGVEDASMGKKSSDDDVPSSLKLPKKGGATTTSASSSSLDEVREATPSSSMLACVCECSSSSIEVSGSFDTHDSSSSSSSYIKHEVTPTDTLQGICLAYNISLTRLRMENNFSGDTLLMAPKVLKIPLDPEKLKSPTRGGGGLASLEEAREAVPGSSEEKKKIYLPKEEEEEEEESNKNTTSPSPPDLNASKDQLRGLIDSLSTKVDECGHPVLTRPERTFLGLLLESNGPGVAEACVAAIQRLMDGDLFGSREAVDGREQCVSGGDDGKHDNNNIVAPGNNGEKTTTTTTPTTAVPPAAAAASTTEENNSATKTNPTNGNANPKSSTKKRLDRLEQRKRQSFVRFSDQEVGPAVSAPAAGGSIIRRRSSLLNSAAKDSPLPTIQDLSPSNGTDSSEAAVEQQQQLVDSILRSFSDQEDACVMNASSEKASEENTDEYVAACAGQKQPADGAVGAAGEASKMNQMNIRRTRSASITGEEENEDCPICLLPLESYDYTHLLQCPSTRCQFNCCMDCLERMIKSCKDECVEASDGNTFRVALQCPNCRSPHLGLTIRDTLLLRKVDKCLHRADGGEKMDEKLSASELRFKEALEMDEDVASAIAGARHREDVFFGRNTFHDEKSINSENTVDLTDKMWAGSLTEQESIWSFDDEEGFEADLTGAHKSFISRHHSNEKVDEVVEEPERLEDVQADSTLLGGLHAFMSDQEQQFVTAHLISGDPARLAVATEMMHYVAALSRQEIKQPKMNKREVSLDKSVRTKVKEVIKEGNEARRLKEEKESRNAVSDMAKQLTTVHVGGVAGGRRVMKRQVDMELRKQIKYMELHPLPLRMPKYAVVTANKIEMAGLTFWDDVWDGTILDAFSKITVTKSLLGHTTVAKQPLENSGVQSVIDAGSLKSKGKGYIDTYKPRVLVASINRDLGQQGIVKGDVVSHFNGEPFIGTATELSELIDSRFEGEILTIVFNADNAVAEALKRRSMV